MYGMGFYPEIKFKEPIQKGKSYMLVANHKSMIDIMLMLSVSKDPIVFVGKKELEKILSDDLKFDLIHSTSPNENNFSLTPLTMSTRNICYLCKKEIHENQLKIGFVTLEPWDATHVWPIHATCYSQTTAYYVDDTPSSCDYCGLSLDLSIWSENQNDFVKKAISTLYEDDPISILYANIKTDDHYEHPTKDTEAGGGFTHYKEKDGKKYHLFGEGGVKKTAEEFQKEFLGEIPINPEVGKTGDEGKPIVETNPEHEISKIYLNFAEKIKSTYL